MTASRTQVVVVTGMSGAGKSTAIHALEDLGFYCCDNLPTGFAPEVVDLCERRGIQRIGLGFDVRLGTFLMTGSPVSPGGASTGEVMAALDGGGARDLHVLFLDAADESLVRRFSETRRPHPMSLIGMSDDADLGAVDVLQGIHRERELLASLRARSTRVIDTTRLNVHELRLALVSQFSALSPGQPGRMATRLVSFGFKFGSPADADLVFDVRFLANPYFVQEMKHRPGTDEDVAAFVLDGPEGQEFVRRVDDLLGFVIPLFAREGKAFLTIAIGCTGGRHRSVAVAEELARRLAGRGLENVRAHHRDIGRGDVAGSRGSDPGPMPRYDAGEVAPPRGAGPARGTGGAG